MTDAKKIEILERLLDERDEQIQELQKENVELQAIIDRYSVVDDEVNELRQLLKEARQLNSELSGIKNEQLRLKKEYRKEMGMFFRKQKTSKFR